MKYRLLFLFLVCSFFVSASDVILVSLHYENGEISLNERYNLVGHYPDRKIQEGDHYLSVVSGKGEKLYSFRFNVPNKIYTDSSSKGGNVIELDEVDFGLLVPYFEEAKDIKIYKGNEELLTIKNPRAKGNYYWIILLLILVILVLIGFWWFNRNTYKNKKEIQ